MPTDLDTRIAQAAARIDANAAQPALFELGNASARAAFERLLETPGIAVFDSVRGQLDELVRARAPAATLSEAQVQARITALIGDVPLAHVGCWAHYPWIGRLVHALPREWHRELRSDRNRHLITAGEQRRLSELRIGIAGLSVGRAVASTLLREGIGGEFRLADFDELSLSNLNRVVGTIADVGVNKVVLAAREIVELDPYVAVRAFPAGVTADNLAAFVDGLDVLIDECDGLAMKVALREAARARRIPVIMATSDRGMLDIERFDREPDRPIFHGLLAGVDTTRLADLPTKEKVPYVMRILGAEGLQPRMAASLVEVKESISTWPQLASSVALGGAMVAHAVRIVALGTSSQSGRFHADLETLVADGAQAALPPPRPFVPVPARAGAAPTALPLPGEALRDQLAFIVACATEAPSGGNIQPWRFEAGRDRIRATIDWSRSKSLLNFADRGTYLALGAALECAHLAATTLGFATTIATDATGWTLGLARTGPRGSRESIDLLLARCSNRHAVASEPIAPATLAAIRTAGAPLDTWAVTTAEARAELGTTLGMLDRVRMLSSAYHHELFNEIRTDHEEARRRRDGLDLASLEFSATDLAVLDVVRSASAMAFLKDHDLGGALGNSAKTAFAQAGGALVTGCADALPATLLEAGRGLQRLWMEATRQGVAIHPWGSPFLFQRLIDAPATLPDWERTALGEAARRWDVLLPEARGATILLVLRLSYAPPPTGRSLRRPLEDVLRFVD